MFALLLAYIHVLKINLVSVNVLENCDSTSPVGMLHSLQKLLGNLYVVVFGKNKSSCVNQIIYFGHSCIVCISGEMISIYLSE